MLSDGTEFDSETVVWTAGVKANPMLADTDFELDEKGRLPCNANLTVRGVTGVFAAGDCAAVPDLSKADPDALTGPSAQHAVRQAKVLARNVIATVKGAELKDYKHKYVGSVASLGLYRGVAELYGVKVRGILGLVHPPHLPRVAHAHLQPQGACGRRLDGRALLPARGRLARSAAGAQERVPAGGGGAEAARRVVTGPTLMSRRR